MAHKDWRNLTRQDFSRLIAKMSGIEIAREYGVHHNAVYYRLRTMGVRNDKKRRRFDPSRDELYDLYQRMPMSEMAKHYGVGETVIFMRLKEHGIGGISRSARLTGKPKSLTHRLAMSRSSRESGVRAGKRNGNWKGGITSDNKLARSRAAYLEWKVAVLARADWKCEACGKEHGCICGCCAARITLHAHHIESFASNEQLRYEVSNGKALCDRCHRLEHDQQSG